VPSRLDRIVTGMLRVEADVARARAEIDALDQANLAWRSGS
jgi:hypothetical protein